MPNFLPIEIQFRLFSSWYGLSVCCFVPFVGSDDSTSSVTEQTRRIVHFKQDFNQDL